MTITGMADPHVYLEPVTLHPVTLLPHFLRWAVLEFTHHTKPRWNNTRTLTDVFSAERGRARYYTNL